MTPLGSHFGTISESELSPVDQKRGSRNCFEKLYPQESKGELLTSPEAPGDYASRAHFQQQKQQLGQQQQQLQQQLQKLLLYFSFCSELLVDFGYFSILDVVVRFQLNTFSNVCIVAPTATQSS